MKNIAFLVLHFSLFLTFYLYNTLIILAQSVNHPENSFYQKGMFFQNQSRYDSAIHYLNKAAKVAESQQQWKTYFASRNQIINTYRLSFQLDTAFSLFNELIAYSAKKPQFSAESQITSYKIAGQILFAKGQYKAAASNYNNLIHLLHKARGAKTEAAASIYQEVGKILLIEAKPDQALSYFLKSLHLRISLYGNKHLAIADIYDDIAKAYHALASPHEAMGYLDQALEIRKALLKEKKSDVIPSLYLLAKYYSDIQQNSTAIRYWRQALDLQMQSGKKTNLSNVHINLGLGRSYHAIKQDSLSWIHYKRAFEIYGNLLEQKDISLLQNTLDNEFYTWKIPAYNYPLKGQNQRGQSQKDLPEMAYQSWSEAASLFNKLSLQVASLFGTSHPDVALFKENAALLYSKQFLEANTKKKALKQMDADDVLKFIFLGEKKADPEAYGENKKAAGLFMQAHDIRLKIFGDKHPKIALNNLHQASFLKQINEFYVQYQKGLYEDYEKSKLSKDEKSEFRNKYHQALKNISLNDQKIIRYYQQAILALMPNYNNNNFLSNPSFTSISAWQMPVYIKDKELLMNALYEKARFISILPTRPDLRPFKDIDYVEVKKTKGKSTTTTTTYTRAYEEATTAYNESKLKVELETAYDAIQNLDQFIAKWSTGLINEKDKFLLASKTKEISLLAMDICRKLYYKHQPKTKKLKSATTDSNNELSETFAKDSKQSLFHEAFTYAEKNKASVLLHSMLASQSDTNYIHKTLGNEQRAIEQAIQILKVKMAEKISSMQSADSLAVNALQDSIFKLSEKYLSFKRETSTNIIDSYGKLHYVGVEQIQKAIDDSTAVLAYNVAYDYISYFLITKNKFEYISENSSKEELEKDILHIRSFIQYKQAEDFIQSALDLKDKLIPKLDDKINKLIIIPDDVLNTLPFEVLLTKRVRVKDKNNVQSFAFLLKSYDISYAYSATLMFGTPIRPSKQVNKGLVAFAPVFSNLKENGLSLNNEGIIQALDDSTGLRSILTESNFVKSLPGTETEAQSIYNSFTKHKQPAQVYIHAEASEDKIKSAQIGSYKYVHLATHGFVNTNRPELSGIMLAKDSTSLEDGILYSGELYNLPLQADLVTLSACDTGLGKIETGEGVIGLPRALLYAGARNVLVSLWKVADASTSNLMADFYNQFLEGQSYSSALRQAKLRMIASSEYAHPYYWSPFILIGR